MIAFVDLLLTMIANGLVFTSTSYARLVAACWFCVIVGKLIGTSYRVLVLSVNCKI